MDHRPVLRVPTAGCPCPPTLGSKTSSSLCGLTSNKVKKRFPKPETRQLGARKKIDLADKSFK